MDKLRVLTVVEQPWPDFVGGSHRVIHETARRLVLGGHKVTVLARRWRRDLPDREVLDGVTIERRVWSHAKPLAGLKPYEDRLRAGDFDVVHVHHPLPEGAALARLAPAVFTYHGPIARETLANGLGLPAAAKAAAPAVLWGALQGHRAERACLEASRRVLVLSEHSRSEVRQQHDVPDAKIRTVPGGVDAGRFRPHPRGRAAARRRLGLPAGGRILLTVRRLEPRMGLEALVDAMALLKDRRALLLVCGKGSLQDPLLRLITRKRLLERVRLTGSVPEPELPGVYQAADLFILPSRELENFGLATLEALASGVPALGTPVGGTVEILKPLEPGLLFKDATPRAMAAKIDRWLARPARLSALGVRARAYARANYRWDGTAEGTLEAYREALRR